MAPRSNVGTAEAAYCSRFMREAAEAGADSLLIADVPALEAEPFVREMEQAGTRAGADRRSQHARADARAHRKPFESLHLLRQPSRHHRHSRRRPVRSRSWSSGSKQAGAPPPVFGFGISTPEHVRAALEAGAKGVICGSAIVDLASRGGDVAQLCCSQLKDSYTERTRGRND